MSIEPERQPTWSDVAAAQDNVVSRAQLLSDGWTDPAIRWMVDSLRWQREFPGVYATFTGPVAPRAKAWATLLYAGEGAALGGRCALKLWGIERDWPQTIEVAVPAERRVRSRNGVRVRRRSDIDVSAHPAALPRRLRLEEALLDVMEGERRVEAVLTMVFRAVQTRRTTAEKIGRALARRRAHRWRAVLQEVLAEVRDGVLSPLERRYLRDVHRRHHLPKVTVNARQCSAPSPGLRVAPEPKHRYRDFLYEEFGVVVEVDGREAHPDEEAFRDRDRDNAVALTEAATLRYGWVEIASDPCGVAAQVATLLRRRGWRAEPTLCSPTCRVSP